MEQLNFFKDTFHYTEHKKYIEGVFKGKEELVAQLRAEGKERIYHVLSFGGDTQSAELLEQHFRGQIHYDFIVHADVGAELPFIHKQVDWWMDRQKQYNNTTPFLITKHGSMEGGLEEMLFRYIYTDYQRFQMPAVTR